MTAHDIKALMGQCHDVLTMAEHPPAGKGGKGGAGQSRPPMPTAILDAKIDLKQKLTSWAQLIGEEAEVVIDADDYSLSIAAWIHQKADWLAAHPAADDFHDEITQALDTLAAPYRPRDHRIFLGIHAGAQIYAQPGQQTVVLPDGRVERTKTLRHEMLANLLDHIDTATVVSQILREYFGAKVTVKKIHTAVSDDRLRRDTGRLEPAAISGSTKLFRVRDVQRRFARVALDKAS